MFTFGKSRSINVKQLLALVLAIFEQDSWPLDSVILTSGKAITNLVDHFKSFLDPAKKYEVGKGSYTGAHLITMAEKKSAEYGKKTFPVIASGDHRATAIMLLLVTGQRDVEGVVVQEIREGEDAKLTALGGNTRHGNVAKLERIDNVKQVLALVEAGTIQKESDLMGATGCNRYQAIMPWGMAELVRLHGVDLEKACSLSQGQLAEVRKAENPAEAVDKVLAEGTLKVKALNQKEQTELYALAETKGASVELLGLLEAIRTNGLATAQNMVVAICEG